MTGLRIGLTQRVSVVEEYGERRDCLDQAWPELLDKMGWHPVPLSNTVDNVETYLKAAALDGLILTSGNDLAHLPGATNPAPERDQFETKALEFAMNNELPVLGVCRGLEVLVDVFGGTLTRIDGHVAVDHKLLFETSEITWHPGVELPAEATVNSFHEWGIERDSVPEPLEVIGTASDGTVECVAHTTDPLIGIMWHPERRSPSATLDRELLTMLFQNKTNE